MNKILICFLPVIILISCSPSSRFAAQKRNENPSQFRSGELLVGYSSYYAGKFHGRRTANGEIFNMYDYTAAHRSLPFGSVILVTNLENGKKVKVRINDRGPYVTGRILDLSLQAAKDIGLIKTGVAKVNIKILKLGDNG